MLKIFLMTNCKGYRLPMIAGVLQYLHIFREDSGHPMQETLSRTRGVLNEEVGEFSLAHLSRLLPHAITRQSRDVADRTYKMLPRIKGICDALASFAEVESNHGDVSIAEDSAELRTTEEFFQLCIRQLCSGQYKPYAADPSKWDTAASALADSVNAEPEPYYRQDTWLELQNGLISLKRSMGKVWLQARHYNEVPGYQPPAAPPEEVKLAPILDDTDPENPEYWSDESTTLPPLIAPPVQPPEQKADRKAEGSAARRPRSRSRRAPQPRRPRRGARQRGGSRASGRRGSARARASGSPVARAERKVELPPEAPPAAASPEPNVPAAAQHVRPRRRVAPRLGFFEVNKGYVFTK